MANLVATREALDRFTAELPEAGPEADRLRRVAETARALIEQDLDAGGEASPWTEHDLAVLVAEGLSSRTCREASRTLFRGVRRRLAGTLDEDADDLAAALALALGAAEALDDPRTAEDVGLVAAAVERPHAGPRLVSAGVRLALDASEADDRKVAAAGAEAIPAAERAVEATADRLPAQPDTALDRVRLALHAARRAEPEAKQQALDRVHALLDDHERRFGPSAAARRYRGELVALRARTGAPAEDVRRDALTMLEAELAEGALEPRTADRLVRAMERAGGLDGETASSLAERLAAYAGDEDTAWRQPMARLLQRAGDETRLLGLWQETLREDPHAADAAGRGDREQAAAGLADRLVRNLRAGLPAPFDAETVERALDALPHRALGRWSNGDVRLVVDHLVEHFGLTRACAFMRDRVLANRTLRKRNALWERALDLHEQAGDEDALLDLTRRAVKEQGLARARLLLAERLLQREERLDEAERALRPLYEARGESASRAHELRRQLAAHPAYREARREAMKAFEERIGVGTPRSFRLHVIHTTPGYALLEEREHTPPEAYEHKRLRTLVRARDLPRGVVPLHLRRGDVIEAPLTGEDADPQRDPEGVRIYWIADPAAMRLDPPPEALAKRLDEEEAAWGIGRGTWLPIKVSWNRKQGRPLGRLVSRGGGPGFPEPIRVDADQLPEGWQAERLGKGKRFWAPVDRVPDEEGDTGRRCYRARGTLSVEAPPEASGTDAPSETSDAAPAEASAASTPSEATPDEAETGAVAASEAGTSAAADGSGAPGGASATGEEASAPPAEASAPEGVPAEGSAAEDARADGSAAEGAPADPPGAPRAAGDGAEPPHDAGAEPATTGEADER